MYFMKIINSSGTVNLQKEWNQEPPMVLQQMEIQADGTTDR